MSEIYKEKPLVKVVMLKGADGDKSKLSELTNDMTFLTQEEIITIVTQIVESGSVGDIDTGFVSTFKETNHGQGLKFWIGTTAEYEAITTYDNNTFYILTDDTTREDILAEAEATAKEYTDDKIAGLNYEEEIAQLNTDVTQLNTHLNAVDQVATDAINRTYALDVSSALALTTGKVSGSLSMYKNGSVIQINGTVTAEMDLSIDDTIGTVAESLKPIKTTRVLLAAVVGEAGASTMPYSGTIELTIDKDTGEIKISDINAYNYSNASRIKYGDDFNVSLTYLTQM